MLTSGLVSDVYAAQRAAGGHADRIWPYFREYGRSHLAPRIGHAASRRGNKANGPAWAVTLTVPFDESGFQTLPRNAVTSANTVGSPGLRTYLAHDESRHHRVSPLSRRSTNVSPGLASARTGRARGSRGYRLGHMALTWRARPRQLSSEEGGTTSSEGSDWILPTSAHAGHRHGAGLMSDGEYPCLTARAGT